METESAFWARRADPSIKLLGFIRNRKIYDKGSACAQNALAGGVGNIENRPKRDIGG